MDYSNITTSDDPRLADAIQKLELERLRMEAGCDMLGEAGIKAMERTRSEEIRLKVLQMRARANG